MDITPLTSAEDLDLVLSAKTADTAAFEELVHRYSGMVFAVAYSRLGNRETAEDLAQEVFLRAYGALGSLTSPEYFSTWLGRIARNLATDWQRSGQRRSRAVTVMGLQEVSGVPDSRSVPQWEIIERRRRETGVNRALAKLTPGEREIVLLHIAEDWSLSDISKKLNVHRTTVGRKLEQALSRLRADVVPLLRETCRPVESNRNFARKTAAAVLTFSGLSGAARAEVLGQLGAAVPSAAIGEASSCSGGSAAGAMWIKICSAATAAGGKLLVTKTSVATVSILVALVGSGYYAKTKIGGLQRTAAQARPKPGTTQLRNTYPPGTISITPSLSNDPMIMTGNDCFIGKALDLQNALANAYESAGVAQIIFDNAAPPGSEKYDIAITPPAGRPEELTPVVRREVAKTWGVSANEDQREMDVLVLSAPNGEKMLTPGGSSPRTRVSRTETIFTGVSVGTMTKTLSFNLGIPVVDETTLKGHYNATIKASNIHDKAAMISAVQQQLGLELKPARRMMKVLLISKAA